MLLVERVLWSESHKLPLASLAACTTATHCLFKKRKFFRSFHLWLLDLDLNFEALEDLQLHILLSSHLSLSCYPPLNSYNQAWQKYAISRIDSNRCQNCKVSNRIGSESILSEPPRPPPLSPSNHDFLIIIICSRKSKSIIIIRDIIIVILEVLGFF